MEEDRLQTEQDAHDETGYGPWKLMDPPALELDCGEAYTEAECHATKTFKDFSVGSFSQKKHAGYHDYNFLQTEVDAYDQMDFDEMNVALSTNLDSALRSESMGDADAAVAKTAAIKNIQKALTARILKRLDDGQPLVEVARKMKAIEGMQP